MARQGSARRKLRSAPRCKKTARKFQPDCRGAEFKETGFSISLLVSLHTGISTQSGIP